MDHRTDSPQLLLDFLSYHETIKAHSKHTVDEYYLDMRNFFRYLKQTRNPTLADKRLDEIDIHDVDLSFIASITLTDIYGYLTYLSRDRLQHQNSENSDKGLSAASRARKLATIRSFFNYICNKRHLLENNPCKDVDTPKQMKSLPRYLTLDESLSLLESVDGFYANRNLSGQGPSILLRKTVLSLKSPTGAFIAPLRCANANNALFALHKIIHRLA